MNSTEPISGQLQLHPLNDCVLVELKQSYQHLNSVKEGKYDSRTEGIVVGVPSVDPKDAKLLQTLINIKGKRVHFEEFKEGARIKRNGKMYSFIKIEDIRGYEDQ